MVKALVTGGAGFIGSHLVTALAKKGWAVCVVDNEFNGKKSNLDEALEIDPSIEFIKMDIQGTEFADLIKDKKPDIVFHEAAVASVPRSVKDPKTSFVNNVMGTLNLLEACKEAGVKRVLFASSSSVYGDDPTLPKKETKMGKVLSPYALTKLVCEELMRLYYELHGLETVSLRYFNVFGPRQDPMGPYAAVIPIFLSRILQDISPIIFGDGKQSRDFTFVQNVVDANILFSELPAKKVCGQSFNASCGGSISVNDLVKKLNKALGKDIKASYQPERQGDIKDSCADISKAKSVGFKPSVNFEDGLKITVEYYKKIFGGKQ